MYVSGRDAAIVGDTRSEVKRPFSSLAGGMEAVVLILVVEIGPVDVGEEISTDGTVSFVIISEIVGIEVAGWMTGSEEWFKNQVFCDFELRMLPW